MAAPLHQPQPSRVDQPDEQQARAADALTEADLALIVGGSTDPDEPPPGGPPKRLS